MGINKKNNQYSNDYGGIDYFRIIAAVLVIAIHTSPLLNINDYANIILARIIARIAVPFFFMTTGFFLYKDKTFSFKEFLKKVGKIYLMAIVFYLPLNIYMGYFNNINILKLLLDLLFNGTLYHLWFLPALILGVFIVDTLNKRLGQQTSFFIVTILYFIGLLGDSYFGIANNNSIMVLIYSSILKVFNYTRNGIFFAPLFIYMGVIIGNKNDQEINNNNLKLGLVLSFIILIIEGLSLHKLSLPKHDSMYISLVPVMFFLFQLLINIKISVPIIIRKMSLVVYLIHPFIIVVLRGIAKVLKLNSILVDNNLIHFILVTIVSVCIAYIICKVKYLKYPKQTKGRAWVEVNLNNLQHNYQELTKLLPVDCEFMAVVKANAYGHGDIVVANKLQKLGCKSYAVASVNEAVRLRKNGIKGEILILGYTCTNELYKLNKYNLTQTAVDYGYAQELNNYKKKIRVHLKLDTGMHRLGEDCNNLNTIMAIFNLPNLKIEGIYTHLCVSDSLINYDVQYTNYQINCFYKTLKSLKDLGITVPKHHIQSSYGLVNYPELKCDYVRVGILLYGTKSNITDKIKQQPILKPLLAVKARVSGIKRVSAHQPIGYGRKYISNTNLVIATLTIGYADGIPRNITNGYVLIKGQRAPIIGLVCMDQMTIDITGVKNVKQDDIVTIIGCDSGLEITAMEVAKNANIITNELLSRLGSRLSRVYI